MEEIASRRESLLNLISSFSAITRTESKKSSTGRRRRAISRRLERALLLGIGAVMKEGQGSRVRFKRRDCSLHVHAPHPEKVISKGTVEAIRGFLTDIGVAP